LIKKLHKLLEKHDNEEESELMSLSREEACFIEALINADCLEFEENEEIEDMDLGIESRILKRKSSKQVG
jgi:hypothetical protein